MFYPLIIIALQQHKHWLFVKEIKNVNSNDDNEDAGIARSFPSYKLTIF